MQGQSLSFQDFLLFIMNFFGLILIVFNYCTKILFVLITVV